ncbi:hypothetical protein FH972_005244 [Carpinus fangiana]|uniref:Uncharacterized protein n=1 Tax=Carpinus fangiana TaxID=176857 RepID=A0A5N6QNN6_9ROSI|nr:hypothetical protein FH972_005244 [Carpinus fangiana]
MKTVIGDVPSSKPISLKKATSTLSTFVSIKNGAYPARHYQPKSETFSDVSQARSHKQIRGRSESNITGGNPIERDEKHWKNKQKGDFGKFGESRRTEIKVKIMPEENTSGRDEGNVGMESETKKHKMKIFAEEIKEESKEIGLADSYYVEPKEL